MPGKRQEDPQRKYWWLLLVILPIILALIAILPQLLKQEPLTADKKPATATIEQKADHVEQKTEQGNNFNNVVGNIQMGPTSPQQVTHNEKEDDNDKEYGWIRYVVVLITVALIGLLGVFPTRNVKGKTTAGEIDQRGEEIKQSSKEGHNVNNVIGNVTITNPVKDRNNP